ncbi:hypothetical protein [Streptomyces sp. Da 82-17]
MALAATAARAVIAVPHPSERPCPQPACLADALKSPPCRACTPG